MKEERKRTQKLTEIQIKSKSRIRANVQLKIKAN